MSSEFAWNIQKSQMSAIKGKKENKNDNKQKNTHIDEMFQPPIENGRQR